jgi:hypothetical protein
VIFVNWAKFGSRPYQDFIDEEQGVGVFDEHNHIGGVNSDLDIVRNNTEVQNLVEEDILSRI